MESNDSKDLRYEKLKDINGMVCIAFSWIIALIMIGIFVRLVLDGDMTALTTSGVSAWGYHYKWPAQSEIAKVTLTFSPAH